MGKGRPPGSPRIKKKLTIGLVGKTSFRTGESQGLISRDVIDPAGHGVPAVSVPGVWHRLCVSGP